MTAEKAFMANNAVGEATAAAIFRAAHGDLSSQRALLQACLNPIDPAHASGYADLLQYEALFYARLCASHGQNEDIRRLGAVLAQVSLTLRAHDRGWLGDAMMVESMAILGRLAADGDELSATAGRELAEMNPPHFIEAAKVVGQAYGVSSQWQSQAVH